MMHRCGGCRTNAPYFATARPTRFLYAREARARRRRWIILDIKMQYSEEYSPGTKYQSKKQANMVSATNHMYVQKRKHLYHPDLERAKSMEDVYHILARKTLVEAKSSQGGARGRYVVGVVGAPGSGKSTLAKQVVHIINAIQGEECAVVLPMDGYHYTKSQLDCFEDPKEAHGRRGAHWTFDAHGFVEKVGEAAEKVDDMLHAPSFDHGQGDPVDGAVCIEKHHSIVVVEGLYLLLDIAHWDKLKDICDETWFIDCDIDESMRRVYNRQTRNGAPPRVARHRIETNDRLNALQVQETAMVADVLVPSLQFRRPWR